MRTMTTNAKGGLALALLAALALGAGLAATACAPSRDDGPHHDGDTHAGGEHDGDDHADHDHAGPDHAADHQGEDDHGEDDHANGATVPGGHGEGIRLTGQQRRRFGIQVRSAASGSLRTEVVLRGEVSFNEDRLVHVSPRVAGVVRDVRRTVGDRVRAGEVLAILDSRELADARAEYLAARGRVTLAETTHERESSLRERQVSSEQDYLDARQVLEEARLEMWAAEQKLHALGLSSRMVRELTTSGSRDGAITRYELRAPIDGVVTARHVSLGESLDGREHVFTVADPSTVWVSLIVYTKDLVAVRTGDHVLVRSEHGAFEAEGEIAMVTPFVETATRSAIARVVLADPDGQWTPGTFVTGVLRGDEQELGVVVPREAVQSVDGRDVVFVEEDGGFHPAPVTVGRSDSERMEIRAGLAAGTPYVAAGAFELKATLATSNLGSHAGHGH